MKAGSEPRKSNRVWNLTAALVARKGPSQTPTGTGRRRRRGRRRSPQGRGQGPRRRRAGGPGRSGGRPNVRRCARSAAGWRGRGPTSGYASGSRRGSAWREPHPDKHQVAQALAAGRLGEGEGTELLGAVQLAHTMVAAVAGDDAGEGHPRDELHELGEDGLATIHIWTHNTGCRPGGGRSERQV